jgi:hypothetical protein
VSNFFCRTDVGGRFYPDQVASNERGASDKNDKIRAGRQREISVTILDFATTSITSSELSLGGLTASQLHDSLWRVTRPAGDVVGYIERFSESRGIRFRAKRLIVRQQRFVPIGEFWSMDEALQCFRMN